MKRPGTAALVLALHLLGLWALGLPATARDGSTHSPEARVLQVWLRSEPTSAPAPAPARPPPPAPTRVAPVLPAPRPTPPMAAALTTPAPLTTPTPVQLTAPEAAPAAPAAVVAIVTPAPAPPPAPPATEPTLVQAQADRRDCPAAPHPAALRERGIEGEVRLLVRVGIDGRAAEVKLQQPSGWRLFDHAAMAQARACRFVPARRGVQAVESWVEFPVRFSLQG